MHPNEEVQVSMQIRSRSQTTVLKLFFYSIVKSDRLRIPSQD